MHFKHLMSRWCVCVTAALLLSLGWSFAATAQTFTTYPISAASASPSSLVAGPNGDIWVVEPGVSSIGRFNPSSKTFVASYLTTGFPNSITVGPDGNLWFTEGGVTGNRLGYVTTSGNVHEFPVSLNGVASANLSNIAFDGGGSLWAADGGRLWKIAISSGSITVKANYVAAGASYITVGPDGNLWFSEGSLGNSRVGCISTAGTPCASVIGIPPALCVVRTSVTECPISGNAIPGPIKAASDGNVWFISSTKFVYRVTPSGNITPFTASATNISPVDLAASSDGNLYFSDLGNASIGRIKIPSGEVADIGPSLAPNNVPLVGGYFGITADAAGNLWFSLSRSNAIGMFAMQQTSVPATGYWWNPAQGGRGFNIEQRGSNLFMASFLYDVSGRAAWYGVGPGEIIGNTFYGTLETYSGGQTLTGAFQVAKQGPSGGAFSITFTSATTAALTWPGGTLQIQRYDFGPGGSESSQPAGTPQSGWWWAPTEGGRGYAVEIQGGSMFLAGYMYDPGGNPIWYASGPTPMTGLSQYQGVWAQFANGQTLTGNFVPAAVLNSDVGNVTIQFSTPSTGTLTFPNGRQVAISRFQF